MTTATPSYSYNFVNKLICKPGYTGRRCELDVNECKHEKPCDQNCFNIHGSYYCTCRPGFQLQLDRQSCRKLSYNNREDAFEARDLENDVGSGGDDDDSGIDDEKTSEMSEKIAALEKVCNLNLLYTIYIHICEL